MFLLGLHPLDIFVVLFFLITILVIGFMSSRRVKSENDFFVGGRKIGGLLQFFLNFGQMADSNSAPSVASEVYRSGIGGIWIAFQLLLLTPFYWFSSIWFRRTRAVTVADLYTDRFGSRGLAAGYAAMMVAVLILLIGFGNIVSYKVAAALLAKPEAAWTPADRASIDDYQAYRALAAKAAAGTLSSRDKNIYHTLENREHRGELASYVSYIRPLPFYIGYTLVVCTLIILGGIKAAALTDAVQGVLIMVFSVMLVPLGLARIGGFQGIHHLVAASKFDLVSQEGHGDYTWYSVAAIILFGITGLAGMASTVGPSAAAARDEKAIRIGVLTGAFAKRLLTLPWAFCGLLALAVLGPGLSDPDAAWGRLSSALLQPGLMGLMLSGIILGHMPSVGVTALNLSAMISRNLYEPLRPNQPDEHYLRVAQVMVFVVLALGIITTLFFSGVVSMLFTIWLFSQILSVTLGLLYFWRGLTVSGIGWSWLIWTALIGIIPLGVPLVPALRQSPLLLVQTEPDRMSSSAAVALESHPLFFDSIANIRSDDPLSASEGIGRFNVENFIVYHLGVPVQKFSSAGLMTCRWLFDTLMPILLLIGLSKLTGGKSAEGLLREERFFARMKTPVAPTVEEEARELALSSEQPQRFDHLKLFPGSNWEFTRWTRHDVIGFSLCWVVVAATLGLLWAMASIGK